MEEFLRYVVRNLTAPPGEAAVSRTESARKIIFRLRLPKSEVGKIIGKQGRTVAAIRNLLTASAARSGQRATVQIEE